MFLFVVFFFCTSAMKILWYLVKTFENKIKLLITFMRLSRPNKKPSSWFPGSH